MTLVGDWLDVWLEGVFLHLISTILTALFYMFPIEGKKKTTPKHDGAS